MVGTADEKIDELKTRMPEDSPHKTETVAPVPTIVSVVHPAFDSHAESVHAVSPLARRMALEKHLDLSTLKGTGPGGRVVRRDIETVLAVPIPLASGRLAPVSQSPANSPVSRSDQIMPLSKLRAAIGRRMAASKTSIPHFYVTHEFKMDALMDLRTQFNNIVPEDEKLSVNDFIVKAVALTLLQFPNLNASLKDDNVLHHGQINVGVAVSVEGGLLTIVCRDADRKPLREIGVEIKAMAARVRVGKVKPGDIEGSTFSISNLGMVDVEDFVAIINPPEAAILAVASARQQPVVDGGVIKPGWRMKATISVDHRISDGVEAAKFMQALAVFLEEPLRLVL